MDFREWLALAEAAWSAGGAFGRDPRRMRQAKQQKAKASSPQAPCDLSTLELQYLGKQQGTAFLLDILRAAYKKEEGIQQPFGGIREPAQVVHNKIRHELTNYDQIRDCLTLLVKRQDMDICEALHIRSQVLKHFYSMGMAIINDLPRAFDVAREETITTRELYAAHERYMRSEDRSIMNERMAARCA